MNCQCEEEQRTQMNTDAKVKRPNCSSGQVDVQAPHQTRTQYDAQQSQSNAWYAKKQLF